MKNVNVKLKQWGQAGIEYLLILTVVAIIVLLSFSSNGLLFNIRNSQAPFNELAPIRNATGFFSDVTRVIQGENSEGINGGWCKDADGKNLTCECPSPSFNGLGCS